MSGSVKLRRAARDWDLARRGVDDNPQALERLEGAALEYAKEMGWSAPAELVVSKGDVKFGAEHEPPTGFWPPGEVRLDTCVCGYLGSREWAAASVKTTDYWYTRGVAEGRVRGLWPPGAEHEEVTVRMARAEPAVEREVQRRLAELER